MSATPEREGRIFNVARKLPVEERAFYLDGACAGDAVLRRQVEELLEANDAAGAFLSELATAGENSPKPGVLPAPAKTLREEHSPSAQPGDTIGRYKLLEKIGEGGFGVVYVAEQREPVKRRVALKVIKLGLDTKQVVARFEAERQALALMDHPNIAKVLDAGATEDGRPFFVMELVKGIPISKYCDQEKLGIRERLDLFIKVCHAIQHAHQKGVIHRDIKPSNILVTLHDGVPVPKVIDFGIAKATQAELTEKTVYTQFQQFIGTPAYMSPEQAEMSGLDIDTRSDIYSLGVLLYELLTGSTPFDSKELLQSGLDEMRKIIRERPPVRPSTRLRQTAVTTSPSPLSPRPSPLATDLDWIVMKCLEKDRARRYETANGLAQDIERHLKHEPVVARPPSVGYRLQKSFRRNRLVFTAAGAVGLALVLGAVVSTWQAFRADQAARVAGSEKARAEKETQRAKESELAAQQNLYAADINLAYQAWRENNLGLALDLLNSHRPTPQTPDLRGWEWRYLWGLCQSDALYTLGQHSDSGQGVFGLALSPDNKLLATGGGPEVGVWDMTSRRLVSVLGANGGGDSVAFSPDGKLLAFGPEGGHGVTLWDVVQHREITHFAGEHRTGFGRPALGFSPSGRQLAIGQKEGVVVLWDLATRAAGLTLKGHSEEINSLAFSPDGQTLVTGSWDRTVRAWSLTNGQEIAAQTNHTHRVQCVAFSPDGKTVASGSWDNTVRIWNLAERRQVAVLTNHTQWVSALAFSPDGSTLASASADFLIKLWDTHNWCEGATLKGSRDEVYGLVFTTHGNTLLSGTKDGRVLAWNSKPRRLEPLVLRRPEDALIRADAFIRANPVGSIPICWHSNGTFNLWNPQTLQQLPAHSNPECFHSTNISEIALSPGGELLAFFTRQGPIYLWDVERDRQIASFALWPSDSCKARFSDDGALLMAVAAGNGLKLWNLKRLEEVAVLPNPGANPWALCFGMNDQAAAVGNEDGTVEVWDLLRKERVANWKAHRGMVTGITFLPEGKRLVTVSMDSTAKLWEIASQRKVWEFTRALNAFYSMAVSPDGKRIAAGTADSLIKIWDSVTGRELVTLKGVNDWVDPGAIHRWSAVLDLAFLPPDGNTLLSTTRHEFRLWHAPSSAEIEAAEQQTKGKTQ